nr:uncharacterized protein LOC131798866 isoform X1 [Pocillopora verrucosa]
MPGLESKKCDKGSVLEIRPTANLWVKKNKKAKKLMTPGWFHQFEAFRSPHSSACLSSSAAATFTFDECKEAKKLGILLDSKDVQNNSDVTVPQQGTKKLDRARG